MLAAQRWPTLIPRGGVPARDRRAGFPASLAASVKDGRLEYFCNTLVSYTLRGVHTKLNVIWDWEAPAGAGDTHFAFYRGTRARVEVRQTKADKFLPELYVIPATPAPKARGAGGRAGQDRRRSGDSFPGVDGRGSRRRDPRRHSRALRVGHEAHFAQVAANFLEYLREPRERSPPGSGRTCWRSTS